MPIRRILADGVVTEEEWNRSFALANGGLVRTRLNGKGDVTQTHVVWHYTKGLPYLTGPLLYNNVLYVIRTGGILSTFNPETGELLRQERLKDGIGDYYASPVAADGKIYFVSQKGKKALCVLYQDTDFGKEVLDGAQLQAGARAMEYVIHDEEQSQ